MPLFTARLNRIADNEIAIAGTLYLHTAVPSDANPANGRVTTGGGTFASGLTVSAGNWTAAAAGDVNNAIDFDFGTANAAVGTVGWWSFVAPTGNVAWGTLPSTTIANGDSFLIDSGSLQLNGATT